MGGRLAAVVVSAALVAASAACRRPTPENVAPGAAGGGALDEVRALIAAGRLDEAAARLEAQPPTGEALYLQGAVWARRAETAPLPTPPPADLRGGGPGPAAPELKPEELRALELFTRATQADAHLSAAHLASADLLAPHALRHFDQQALARTRGARRGAPTVSGPAPGEPDWTAEGVLQHYQRAVASESSGVQAVEKLIAFATRTGRLDEAEAGFRELVRREGERAGPLVRYGDFLRDVRGEPLRAVGQYQQALIWEPGDEATGGRIADIYLQLGVEHFARREYMTAQARFDEAAKYVKDSNSPQGLRLRDYVGRLREIRGGR